MLLLEAGLSLGMVVPLTTVFHESERVKPADLRVLSLLRGAVGEISSKPLLWRLFVAMAVTQIGMWTMLPYTPIYIARLASGDTVTAVGVVLSGVGIGQAVASPASGYLMPRFRHPPALNLTSS